MLLALIAYHMHAPKSISGINRANLKQKIMLFHENKVNLCLTILVFIYFDLWSNLDFIT